MSEPNTTDTRQTENRETAEIRVGTDAPEVAADAQRSDCWPVIETRDLSVWYGDERALDGFGESDLARAIRGLYATGFEQIALTAADGVTEDQRRAIRNATRKLVGVEVLEETGSEIVLKNVLDASDVSLRKSVVRLRAVALDVVEDATTAIAENDPALARRAIDREDEIDRVFDMVSRQFQRSLASFEAVDRLGLDRSTAFEYYATARELERVGDHAETIASVAIRADRPIHPERNRALERVGAESIAAVEDAVDAMLEEVPTERVFEVLDRCDALAAEVADLDRRAYDVEAPASYWPRPALDAFGRIAEHARRIGDVAVQSAARRGALA